MRVIVSLVAIITSVQCTAPIIGTEDADPISDNYIVVLKKEMSEAAFQSHLSAVDARLSKIGTTKKRDVFNIGAFKAYALNAPNTTVATLAGSPEIDYVEREQVFTISSMETSNPSKRNVQAIAPWNLARISHRQRGSTDYVYQPTTGTWVYTLDTGAKVSHQEFQGRAIFAYSTVGSGSCDDLNGHGTHLAGIVSSETYGVVRFAGIVGVKVLDDTGSSTTSAIISAIKWAVQDIQNKGRVGKATGLLAVGGAYSAALNAAVASASSSGLMFAVAAGSEGTTGGNTSPGTEPTACVVGATTMADARLPSSNMDPTLTSGPPDKKLSRSGAPAIQLQILFRAHRSQQLTLLGSDPTF